MVNSINTQILSQQKVYCHIKLWVFEGWCCLLVSSTRSYGNRSVSKHCYWDCYQRKYRYYHHKDVQVYSSSGYPQVSWSSQRAYCFYWFISQSNWLYPWCCIIAFHCLLLIHESIQNKSCYLTFGYTKNWYVYYSHGYLYLQFQLFLTRKGVLLHSAHSRASFCRVYLLLILEYRYRLLYLCVNSVSRARVILYIIISRQLSRGGVFILYRQVISSRKERSSTYSAPSSRFSFLCNIYIFMCKNMCSAHSRASLLFCVRSFQSLGIIYRPKGLSFSYRQLHSHSVNTSKLVTSSWLGTSLCLVVCWLSMDCCMQVYLHFTQRALIRVSTCYWLCLVVQLPLFTVTGREVLLVSCRSILLYFKEYNTRGIGNYSGTNQH